MSVFDGAVFDPVVFDTGSVVGLKPAGGSGGGKKKRRLVQIEDTFYYATERETQQLLAIASQPKPVIAKPSKLPKRKQLAEAEAVEVVPVYIPQWRHEEVIAHRVDDTQAQKLLEAMEEDDIEVLLLH